MGVLTSSERGETVTAEICVSAAGAYMPPMLIFPRKRMQNEFELGLPPGGWAECYETGWMTTEIFSRWFKKFVKFSRASKDNVVLLITHTHTHYKFGSDRFCEREWSSNYLSSPPMLLIGFNLLMFRS